MGAFPLWDDFVPSLCVANSHSLSCFGELWHQGDGQLYVVCFTFFVILTAGWVAAGRKGSHVSIPFQHSCYLCCHTPTTRLLLGKFLLPLGGKCSAEVKCAETKGGWKVSNSV